MTYRRSRYIIGLLAAGLAACDGGPVSRSAMPPAPAPESAATVTVAGRATKGPLAGARIEIFVTAPDGRASGDPVASTLTDQAGNWSVAIPADHQGLLVQSVGGAFVDEADPDPLDPRTVILDDDQALLSFLPPGETVASITLVSDALVRKARLEANSNNFATRLQSNRDVYELVMGLDPLATTAADPLAPSGTDAQRRYALIAGGLAYALNALAVERGQAVADFATIDLLLDDLIDCRLDGLGLGGQVLYDIAVLRGRSLNDEILRFRNNHFDDYANLDAPVLDTAGCEPTPGSDDVEPPVFVQLAPALTLAADDASGVTSTVPELTTALEGFVVEDNRADSARIEFEAGERLPLGTTTVRVTATDGWGNQASANWSVTVADLTPPVIAAPPDVRIDASGVLTPVNLGSAIAMDNVSATLTLTNDAPAAGFPVGDTQVIWRAVDAAGLVGEASQTVTVIGASPALNMPILALPGAVGSQIDIDLAAFFDDPFDATLTYRIDGLPAGSGLTIDPLTGRLTGIATAADLAASPLQLTVTADNGQFALAADFTLPVAAREPRFALSSSALVLEEDFATAPPVIATPEVVTPAGVVSFSVSIDNPIANVSVSAAGRVDIAAVADAFGSALVQVQALNLINGEVVVQPLALQISPVNDAPVALVANERLSLLSDLPAQTNLAQRFADVDDAQLTLSATGLPGSLSLSADGQLQGVPQAFESRVPAYPVAIVATDAEGATAETLIVLEIVLADRDGDGLSDAAELAAGTNPDAIDSDGDGVDDFTEVAAGSDPLLPAANVIYVAPGGANDQSGASFASALRDNDGLMMVPPGLSAEQPTFVLYAASDQAYGGSLWLMPPCDNIVLAGSVDAATGRLALDQTGAPQSRFTAIEAPSFELDGCSGVTLQNLTVADNTRHAIHSEFSRIALDNVHLINNTAELSGGALYLEHSDVELNDIVATANRSAASGGAVALLGNDSLLALRNVVLNANVAVDDGGAVFVDAPGATVRLDNVLATTNTARRGAALYARTAASVDVAHATLAFNQSLIGVPDGAAISVSDQVTGRVRDSVLMANLNVAGAPRPFGPGIGSDFNSLDTSPVGAADSALAADARVFAEQFFLTPEAQAIDRGSVSAVDAGLAQRYVAAGSVLPDTATSDRGFHYARRPGTTPSAASLSASVTGYQTPNPRYARYRAIDFIPRVDDRRMGPGHRVRIRALDGRSDLIGAVRSIGSDRRVRAVDLGDGRYRVYRRDINIAATQFELSVDDTVAEQAVTFVCELGGCNGLPAFTGP